jgi:hypothetical protein
MNNESSVTRSESSSTASLPERIRRREARCGIIGLAYVGLPLALEFARAGSGPPGSTLARRVDQIKDPGVRACRSRGWKVPRTSGAAPSTTSTGSSRRELACRR